MTELELYNHIDFEIQQLNFKMSFNVLSNSVLQDQINDLQRTKIIIAGLVAKYYNETPNY